MILTVTPNPCVHNIVTYPGDPGDRVVIRPVQSHFQGGGKGINAARAARTLGANVLALVTHGAFIHVLLSVLLGRRESWVDAPDPRRLWLLMNNAGITRLDYTSRYATLVYANRLDHLPRELITD